MAKVKIDTTKERISCCVDNELSQNEVEQLVDSLLDNSLSEADAAELHRDWKNMYSLSSIITTDVSSELLNFKIKDISSEITGLISSEPAYGFVEQPKITHLPKILMKPQMSIDAKFMQPLKSLMAASAIAASIALVASNLAYMQNNSTNGYTNNSSMVTLEIDDIKLKNTPVIATRSFVPNNVKTVNTNKNKPSSIDSEHITILTNTAITNTVKNSKLSQNISFEKN